MKTAHWVSCRWCSGGFTFRCNNDENFGWPSCRNAMLRALERRFDQHLPPEPSGQLTDNGSCDRAHEVGWLAQMTELARARLAWKQRRNNERCDDNETRAASRQYQIAVISLMVTFSRYNKLHPTTGCDIGHHKRYAGSYRKSKRENAAG